MSDTRAPEGYRSFGGNGGFVSVAGPFFYRERRDDDLPNVFHYGFRSTETHRNTNGVVHGGALVTFADSALGATVHRAAERSCATISLNSEFVSAAEPGSWIDAVVEITDMKRSVAFARCTLSENGKILLTASGIWKLFKPGAPGRENPSV